MKAKVILSFLIVVVFLSNCNSANKTLKQQLEELPCVVSVDSIFTDSVFAEQYEVYFEQLIDHNDKKHGSFNQRVIVSHSGFEKPMVAVLEGYYIWNGREVELTRLIKCNQINIEHRFFKDSKPDSIIWEKLTIWQAATDQHKIITALQKIYKQNWLTTGISKGGQATMFHRSFYPNDVIASVPYVAPLNFEREDNRIYEFLNTVGTDYDRKRIYDFQNLCFEHFDELNELLKQKSKEKKWSFAFGYEKAMQYTILEYSFAFWQWGGYRIDDIPDNSDTVKQLFDHLFGVSGFSFFEDAGVEANRPFFWGALTEMGIYGYKTQPFKKYLGNTTNYTFDFTAPKGTSPKFDKTAMQKVKNYLDNDAENMLFIVGGLDTWGATAYEPSGNNNLARMTLPTGHHGTRIKDFSDENKELIYLLIEEWMGVEINE